MNSPFNPNRSRALLLCAAAAVAACASSPSPEPAEPINAAPAPAHDSDKPPPGAEPKAKGADGESAQAPPSGAARTREIPSECAPNTDGCVPPIAFAKQLCRGKFPDLALVLFSKRMPWQKAYIKAEWLEPVNAYGGEQSERWLQFGEPVVILRKHTEGGSDGVKVSGPADVDILRWDGTCATVRQEMLANSLPVPMQSPRIIWKRLEASTQEALLQDARIKKLSDGERSACRGSSATHPEDKCDEAMKKLTDAIVAAVRSGIALPEPSKLPEWTK